MGGGIHTDMASCMYGEGRTYLRWSEEEDAAIRAGAAAGMTDSELGVLMKCSYQAVASRRRTLSIKRSVARNDAEIEKLQEDPLLLLAPEQREDYRRREASLGPLLTNLSVRCEKCLAIITLKKAREGGFWLHCGEPQRIGIDPEVRARREMNPSEPEAK